MLRAVGLRVLPMRWFILTPCLLLSACASARPAPIGYGGAPGAAPAPAREGALAAYALRPEDVQVADPALIPRSHRVSGAETLYDVATRYQIPLLALIGYNGLEPPYALAPGQVLRLPPPRFHVVRAGERFEDIAARYSIDTRSLALLNRLTLPHAVREGERLVLPALESQAAAPSAGEAPAVQRGRGRYVWPLRGRVVTEYGAQAGGVRSDGIEIAGRAGDRIGAAADGAVVYAGQDLPGYGALVLVRHGDGAVTAYGYGRRALVREGQSVRAGAPLAELGDRPGGARLLFQVRRGRETIDPLPLLGAP
jgi:lipoprotein NlpD